ncbi:MAG: hypothetical protein QXJ51_03690 [Sulfolobales archaeon]
MKIVLPSCKRFKEAREASGFRHSMYPTLSETKAGSIFRSYVLKWKSAGKQSRY